MDEPLTRVIDYPDGSQVLIDTWSDGTVTAAYRVDPSATWGRPVDLAGAVA